MIKGEARVFFFVVTDKDAVAVTDLDLPAETRIICCYRDDKFTLPHPEDKLRAGDEVALITHSRNLPALEARWGNRNQGSKQQP